MTRLKVCQIIPTLVQGGAEKQTMLLARHLDPQRFDSQVIVLTHTGPLETELADAGIPIHHIGNRRQADPWVLLRLYQKIRLLKPDIVHTWLFAANSYGRLAAARNRVPVIVAGERSVDPWKSRWQLAIDRWSLKYTTRIVTNNSAVVDFYHARGIDADNFSVIPNAVVPPVQPALSRKQLFDRIGLPPRAYVVAAIGRLWPQKGYSDLMFAAELLRSVLRDVWVIILGDGPQRVRLQQLRDRYGAHEAVRLLGHRQDASEILSACDLLWNCSRYEGQNNSILEAMAWGKPVVASDIPGNRELVEDDRTGYLVPLGDVGRQARASYNLLRDAQRLQRFGEAARLKIEREFTLPRMVDRYQRLYLELFEQQPGGSTA